MFLKLGRPTYVFSCLPKLSSMPAESGSSSHTHSTTVSCCQWIEKILGFCRLLQICKLLVNALFVCRLLWNNGLGGGLR